MPSERFGAVCCHLVALLCNSFLLGILVPIIVKYMYPESAFARRHANQSINFQINLILWGIISLLLCPVLIGFVGLFIMAACAIIFPIVASLRAASGEEYNYPLTIQFLR